MKPAPFATALLLALGAALPPASADVLEELLQDYRRQGAASFSAERGERLWTRIRKDPRSGQERSCASCHTEDPRQTGRHARTGKTIRPMARSVNPQRFTDARKVEKWFRRNCKWTLGRTCTPTEKGDILTWLSNL